MEFRGRVNDWIGEIRQARQRGDTVLFVADSSGRAERHGEILQEYDIVAIRWSAPRTRTSRPPSRRCRLAFARLSLPDASAAGFTPRPTSSRKSAGARQAAQLAKTVPLRPCAI
jgi:hypothetical protein